MKKATMKDIARMANVSVATVSYVLNNVQNQSIPEKTRCQILQIAKELNYVPNLAARSLIKRKTGLVGILLNQAASMPYWKRQNHFSFVHGLEMLLTGAGYHTLLITLDPANPTLDVIAERKLDAVFLVDVKDDLFYSISSRFVEGVPLILIDSLVEDQLFNQINYDYKAALDLALASAPLPCCFIMERFNNEALTRYIEQCSGLPKDAIYTVSDLAGLDAYLDQTRYEHAIVMNEFIGSYAERSGRFSSLTVICTCSCPEILAKDSRKIAFQEDKSATAFKLMEQLLKDAEYHSNKDNTFFVKVKH